MFTHSLILFCSTEFDEKYILRNPTIAELDSTPDYSEHEAGTEQVIMQNHGLIHNEGGWPKDVDVEDPDAKERYRKKFEKVSLSWEFNNIENWNIIFWSLMFRQAYLGSTGLPKGSCRVYL